MQKNSTKKASQNINIDRLASLSRLSFENDGQKELAAAELAKMAEYTYSFFENQRDDTVLPFSYCVADNAPREDEPCPRNTEECQKILALSPSNQNGYISVPKIIKGDAE